MAYGVIMGQSPNIPENPITTASNVSYNNSSTKEAISGNNVQLAVDQLFSYTKNKDTTLQNNYNNLNNNYTDLSNKYNDLFTSVSNGKKQIAGAITDKGVSTSNTASFSTMANNIRQIQTGGGLGFLETLIKGNYFNPGRRIYNYSKGSGWVIVLTESSGWTDSGDYGSSGTIQIIDVDSKTVIGAKAEIKNDIVQPMRVQFETNSNLDSGWKSFGTNGEINPNGEVGILYFENNATKLDFSESSYNALKNACRVYTP